MLCLDPMRFIAGETYPYLRSRRLLDLSVGEDMVCGVTRENSMRCWNDLGEDVTPTQSQAGLRFSYYQLDEWVQSEDLLQETPYKTGSESQLYSAGDPLLKVIMMRFCNCDRRGSLRRRRRFIHIYRSR